MNNYLIVSLIVLLIIIFLYKKKKFQKKEVITDVIIRKNYFKNNNKNFVWIYYENPVNSRFWSSFYGRRNDLDIPAYIFLVFNSIMKNCSNYNIVILNKDNLKYFIKDDFNLMPDSKIPYTLRINFIKYYILYNYGGIWLDECIILKNLEPLVDKLKEYDVIGFGCDDSIIRCKLDIKKPRNDILIARKKTLLMYKCYKDMYYILKNFYNYPSFEFNDGSSLILWKNLEILLKNGKTTFYQFNTEYDGSRDYNDKIIDASNQLSLNYTNFLNPKNVYFITIDKDTIHNNFDFQWFLRLSPKQLIESNMWISYLYRFAMDQKNEYYSTTSDLKINLPPTAEQYLYSIYNNNEFFNPIWQIYFNSSTRNS